jgi:hypothetical protein
MENSIYGEKNSSFGEKTVGMDFDGVIHDYRNGWEGYGVISGEPVPGIAEQLVKLIGAGYAVKIVTSRALTQEGRTAILKWLADHGMLGCFRIHDIVSQKVPCMVYFDDRAVTYRPGMDLLETVRGFTPWMSDRPIESALE